ncbi:hypothetical protein FA15DRAFT_204682 [Coprinopsis marcescibilis]|uniref:Uncharacterized protein n=1 Tax=Coprinopsis marcescibilis TaxID=230819 RepID=A0A5C3LB12_COPMA|nr:hypothetical protein FA15DRAFT_204682 [Coprinopsis marcescibilis]
MKNYQTTIAIVSINDQIVFSRYSRALRFLSGPGEASFWKNVGHRRTIPSHYFSLIEEFHEEKIIDLACNFLFLLVKKLIISYECRTLERRHRRKEGSRKGGPAPIGGSGPRVFTRCPDSARLSLELRGLRFRLGPRGGHVLILPTKPAIDT